MIIFRTEIIGSFPERIAKSAKSETVADDNTISLIPVVPVSQPLAAVTHVVPIAPPLALPAMAAHSSLLRIRTQEIWSWFSRNVAHATKLTVAGLRVTWRRTTLWSKRFAAAGIRASIVTAYMVWRVSLRTWHELEPYCRRFDHFLDQKLHRNKTAATALDVGAMVWKDMIDAYQRADAYARKLLRN